MLPEKYDLAGSRCYSQKKAPLSKDYRPVSNDLAKVAYYIAARSIA